MKNWITLIAIAIGLAVYSQHGNMHGNTHDKPSNNQQKPKVKPKVNPKLNPKVNPKGNQKPKMHPNSDKNALPPNAKGGGQHQGKSNAGPAMKHAKFNYKKDHANFVYMYNYGPYHYPTKNYGQWRSQQARNKHNAYPVVYQLNVLNAIIMIRERNSYLLLQFDTKIDRCHSLLIERHNAGLITDVQFTIHLATLDRMRVRRGHYHY